MMEYDILHILKLQEKIYYFQISYYILDVDVLWPSLYLWARGILVFVGFVTHLPLIPPSPTTPIVDYPKPRRDHHPEEGITPYNASWIIMINMRLMALHLHWCMNIEKKFFLFFTFLVILGMCLLHIIAISAFW